MITFSKNGEALDMGNFSMTYRHENSAFSDQTIKTAASIPITIPNTPNNRRILGFPDQINNIRQFRKNDTGWLLTIYGIPFQQGELRIFFASDTIKISFMGADFSGFTGKNLSDLDFGGTRSFLSVADFLAHAKTATQGTVDDFDCAFPFVVNTGMFRDVKLETGGIAIRHNMINYYDGNDYISGNPDFLNDGVETDLIGKKFENTMVPFPYLVYTIKQTLRNLGITASGSLLEHQDVKRIVTFNNNAVNGNSTTTYPVDDNYDLKNHVPSLSVKAFLQAVKNGFNAGFYSDSLGNVEIIAGKDILASDDILDLTDAVSPGKETGFDVPDGYKFTIPNINVGTETDLSKTINNGETAIDIPFGAPSSGISAIDPFYASPTNDQFPRNVTVQTEMNLHASYVKKNTYTNWWGFFLGYRQTLTLNRDIPVVIPQGNDGTQVTDFELTMGTALGLYNYWWEPWIQFMLKTKPVTVNVRFSYQQLLNFSFKKKIRIKDSLFLASAIEHTLTPRGIESSKLELYKI